MKGHVNVKRQRKLGNSSGGANQGGHANMRYMSSNDYEVDHENDYEIKHNCLSEEGVNAAYMMTSLFNSPSSLSSSSTAAAAAAAAAAANGAGVAHHHQLAHHQLNHQQHQLSSSSSQPVKPYEKARGKSTGTGGRKQGGRKQQQQHQLQLSDPEAKVKVEMGVTDENGAQSTCQTKEIDTNYHVTYHGQQHISTHQSILFFSLIKFITYLKILRNFRGGGFKTILFSIFTTHSWQMTAFEPVRKQ